MGDSLGQSAAAWPQYLAQRVLDCFTSVTIELDSISDTVMAWVWSTPLPNFPKLKAVRTPMSFGRLLACLRQRPAGSTTTPRHSRQKRRRTLFAKPLTPSLVNLCATSLTVKTKLELTGPCYLVRISPSTPVVALRWVHRYRGAEPCTGVAR